MVETATFALGCFWGPDDYFSKLPGVVRTRVGYSGGSTENPTYTDLGDHTETIEIEFDPSIISYEELLNHFFKKHNAGIVQSTQYKSAIFTHNKKQYTLAEKRKNQEQEKT
ncbi:peptide-methionine (S)-S-oxide reductase, partial [Patescibacteria group bacterium]|nr:peptide-methionine (S)-S-oxide reductase [Patescibacteria group bacterium]